MQLSKLNLALTRIGKAPFTPKSLFSTGEQGVFYDVSDYKNVCFEDSAGTIPITSPLEKPVGLMLDKSKGLALGTQLLSNGGPSFTVTTGWAQRTGNISGSVTVSSGNLRVDSGTYGFGGVLTPFSTVVGKTYFVTASAAFVSGTSGTLRIYKTDNTDVSSNTVRLDASAATTVSGYFVATATTTYITLQSTAANTVYDWSFVKVQEIAGNHATQSTTTSRPTLSARYNLLTKTEDFADAAWTKTNATITANAVTAPDGTTTADGFVDNATNSLHQTLQSTTGVSGAYTASVSVKAGFYNYALVQLVTDGTTKRYGVVVDLNNGAVTATSSPGSPVSASNSVTSLGSGWYRITLNATNTSGNVYLTVSSVTSATPTLNGFGLQDYAGGSNTCFYIWGADLRVANDGVGLPAYQRVDTATDYDYAGFPPYLKFDGTDDSMVTNSINFTATDKMTVFAGVRKLSDGASQIIAEISAASSTNAGSFGLFASTALQANSYAFQTGGSLPSTGQVISAGYAPPQTNVITGLGNISGDSAILRINGAQAASSTADQGTGNYGNYPLYIGRRGGSTLPFNGRLYSLVVCGKTASASEIASTESYINAKTKAY